MRLTKNVAVERGYGRLTLSALMGTTALVLSTGFALAQEMPGSSDIRQIGSGNSLSATTDGQSFLLNSADDTAVQNAGSGNNNTLIIDVRNTADNDTDTNYIFVTQNGMVTSTITIDGGSNTVYLREFASIDEALQTIAITGDGNTVDASTNSTTNYGLFGVALQGDNITVNVTNDAFSAIALAVYGSGDRVTVNQDNLLLAANSLFFNEVMVEINSSADFVGLLNNEVIIEQIGINNKLDFTLSGNQNKINVTQGNDHVSPSDVNNLIVSVEDDNTEVNFSTYGPGTNVFSVGGTGSITVNSATGVTSDFSPFNAVSDLQIYGTDHIVEAINFSDVSIRIGTSATATLNAENIVYTSGNVDVEVDGNENTLDFTNGYDDNEAQPTVSIGGTGLGVNYNFFELENIKSVENTAGSSFYSFVVAGNNNETIAGFKTVDVENVDVKIDGMLNAMSGTLAGYQSVLIDVFGNTNELRLTAQGTGQENLDLRILGNGNQIKTEGGGGASYNIDYIGHENVFNYVLGTSDLVHTVGGNFFRGSVTAQSSGYSAQFSTIGSGWVDMQSNGSSLRIESGCDDVVYCPAVAG
jgi:hypothetical protein